MNLDSEGSWKHVWSCFLAQIFCNLHVLLCLSKFDIIEDLCLRETVRPEEFLARFQVLGRCRCQRNEFCFKKVLYGGTYHKLLRFLRIFWSLEKRQQDLFAWPSVLLHWVRFWMVLASCSHLFPSLKIECFRLSANLGRCKWFIIWMALMQVVEKSEDNSFWSQFCFWENMKDPKLGHSTVNRCFPSPAITYHSLIIIRRIVCFAFPLSLCCFTTSEVPADLPKKYFLSIGPEVAGCCKDLKQA